MIPRFPRSFALFASAILILCDIQIASAGYFTVPYNANVFIKPLGGDLGAVTELGYFNVHGDPVSLFTGLPANPSPNVEIGLGFYAADSSLDFWQKSVFGGPVRYAASNLNDARSLNTFFDTNNSLGMGGSAIEQLDPSTWRFHWDNAASLEFDDDDNDLFVQIRLEAVPEASSLALAGFAAVGLIRWLRAQRNKTRLGLR